MKIDINVIKIDPGYQAITKVDEKEIKGYKSLSFSLSIVSLGEVLYQQLHVDVLSPDHDLTIKLIHE